MKTLRILASGLGLSVVGLTLAAALAGCSATQETAGTRCAHCRRSVGAVRAVSGAGWRRSQSVERWRCCQRRERAERGQPGDYGPFQCGVLGG